MKYPVKPTPSCHRYAAVLILCSSHIVIWPFFYRCDTVCPLFGHSWLRDVDSRRIHINLPWVHGETSGPLNLQVHPRFLPLPHLDVSSGGLCREWEFGCWRGCRSVSTWHHPSLQTGRMAFFFFNWDNYSVPHHMQFFCSNVIIIIWSQYLQSDLPGDAFQLHTRLRIF